MLAGTRVTKGGESDLAFLSPPPPRKLDFSQLPRGSHRIKNFPIGKFKFHPMKTTQI